ncbi:MAG: hypothetical protein AAGI63_00135, partial [Planctomycetota bacterium]
LYPVRGIRRKNVGEFLLLSLFAPAQCYSGVTLRPTTLVEARSYERWQEVANELAPRAVFDAAHHEDVSFADNLAASRFVLSTSVAEGFGMAFLEPWLAHREVIARRLGSVTQDFERSGVRLNKLYDELPIPGSRSWIADCRAESNRVFDSSWQSVAETFRPTSESAKLAAESDTIDFAELTPTRQIEVLLRLQGDRGFETAVRKGSSKIIDWMHQETDQNEIECNIDSIGQHFSLESTGTKLQQIYEQMINAAVDANCDGPINAGDAIQIIHDARPLFPCRMENFDD